MLPPRTSTNEPLRIAVVIPAYNEADHVGEVIASLPEWVDAVYVVDDRSTDSTAEVVESVRDSRVTLIRHEQNRGVGGAMITGYKRALAEGCDVIVKMDADGQMNPANLERLCRPLADNLADYVKGNRFYVLNANESMPGQRKFGSIALSFMTKVASGYWHVFDSQCGYTAIRASFLRMIDLDRIARDYFFENDMLIWLSTTGARVVDVPVSTLYGREVSDVSIGRVILTFPPRLLGGLFFRIMRSYFVLDFGAIGGLLASGLALMAFGLIFGSIKWIQGSDAGVPATTGTVMIAVLPLIVGVQLVLQAFAMEVSESPGAEETRQVVHQLTVRGSLD